MTASLSTLWKGWFTSTGAPPAWGLVRYLVAGLLVGAALAGLLPDFRATLLSALTGAVVAASGSAGPSGVSRRIALIGAGLALVLTVVAFATGGDPVWAAIAGSYQVTLGGLGKAAATQRWQVSQRRRSGIESAAANPSLLRPPDGATGPR